MFADTFAWISEFLSKLSLDEIECKLDSGFLSFRGSSASSGGHLASGISYIFKNWNVMELLERRKRWERWNKKHAGFDTLQIYVYMNKNRSIIESGMKSILEQIEGYCIYQIFFSYFVFL